jgi:hypothetical protein
MTLDLNEKGSFITEGEVMLSRNSLSASTTTMLCNDNTYAIRIEVGLGVILYPVVRLELLQECTVGIQRCAGDNRDVLQSHRVVSGLSFTHTEPCQPCGTKQAHKDQETFK